MLTVSIGSYGVYRAAGVAFVLSSALVLAGCGRAGAPVKPSKAAIETAKKEKRPAPAQPVPNAQNPDKPFILDSLLD